MAAYAALLSLARTTDLSTTQNESIFSPNAVEQVRSIHDYVNFLLSFFEEYPYKVNRWEGRIRDVAYDTEDIIEVFVWQKIQSCSNAKANPSHVRLEVHLKDIIQKVGSIAGEVMEERPAYRPPSSSSSSSSRLAAAAVNEAVIGLDDDIKAIEERLCGMSSQLQVIPIVGMGGIGKSTLARTLYDNQYMTERFDIRAWVVVSQDYNPHRFRKILLDSMRSLGKEQTSGDEIDESEMALKVYRNLKWRRYLIVVDDVWSTYVWDDMRKIFPDDNNGSRIILTTRQLDVATYSAGPVHEMTFMNDSQSWDLLKQKVFGSGDCPSELEEVGKEIAGRCEGLPLAVVLVAGVLSPVNKTRASWEEIAKRMNPVVGREIEEILSLSYTYLPHHLRACFLFIGYFLEDVNIHTSRLVRLWVAEGLVKHQSRSSKSLEEDAEEYLEDLVKRNLVIVTSRKSDGKIKTCRLHDMVRGLCMKKAHEEKFLHVRDGRDIPLMNKRRISFSHSDKNTVWGATSLTILGFQVENIPSLLGSYKLLRVLDALGLDLEELPSEAFELYHLRYLAVMGSFRIPSLVCNLVNLQTLIIHLASGKIRGRYDDLMPQFLPLEIWRMPQLRHLFFHAPRMLPVPLFGISHLPLENLQTLFLVKDLVWDEEILKMIPNVKRLGIYYTNSRNYHLYHLKDLHKLEKLEVSGYMGFSWRGQSPSFPCTLKKLTLVGGGFPWRDMAVVGLLPCLKVLKLLNYACDGGTWETGDEEFPLLNVLHIEESYLQIWTTQSNPFPTLKHLVLRSCQLLTEIPEEIGEISTLELIEVDSCTNCLVESAKKIKADQESFGNDALQLRASHEVQLFFEGMALSTESEAQPKGTRWKTGLIAGQGNGGIFSVADYAALLSLAQATNLSGTRDNSLFSSDAKEKVRLIHNYVNSLLFYPEKVIPWAGRIRGLAYETEDIIDVFAWQEMQSRYRVMIPSRVKLEEQLIDVTQEIGLIAGEVVEEQPAYLTPPSSSSWSGTASNDAVVGLYEDIVAIKNRLCGKSFNLQVIPIVGMGGIGKSTLARSVYEDQSIIETFRIRAWVVVSQDYSQHKFWETLLGSINSFERERKSRYKTHTSENANRVHQILMGRRYLVVMDDVWNTKVFDDVMHMFPDENNGSRIILTTRQLDVASYTDSAGPVHQMQLMKDYKSFDLLKQKLFCPIRLEGVVWEIAHRCAGLPLAVVLVAGVLSVVDPTRDSWEEVAGNMAYDVERASEEILSMSYMLLPHHLRPCLLYMGGFPKNEGHIHAPTLVKLWVAEGFLRLENGCRKSLEEEGEEYLEVLVNRNLVMVNSRKIDGKIKSCSLHDLVRDFCISKAGQEQFLHVLDGRDSPHRVEGRHISLIHSNVEGIVCPEVRTFLSFQPLNSALSWQLFLQSSRLLKVLTAVASSPEELFQFPPNTFQLFHLRYLALIGSCGIPSAVSNLANLQTLIVRPDFHRGRMYRNLRAYERETYPFSLVLEIWRMQQLRHLILHYPCVLSHPRASDPPLENLQTLLHVENLEWNEKIVQMIPNIKTLGLVYTTSQYYSLHHLDGLLRLEKLQLTGSMQFFWMRYDRILSRTLKRLTLLKCEHPWEDMWTIGSSLPNLEVLRLLDHASHGTKWETRGHEFPKLELLVIDESSLEYWISDGCHLPRLKRLVIRSCRRLRKIPEGIGEIPTLKLIEVTGYCKRTLLESLEQIKEDQESAGNDGLQVRSIDSVEVQEEEEEEGEEKEEKEKERRWRRMRMMRRMMMMRRMRRTGFPSEYLPASSPPPAAGFRLNFHRQQVFD